MIRKIKIIPSDEYGKFWSIELDGIQINEYVQSVNLKLIAGEFPRVLLELVPMEIDIPADIEALITAEKREKAGDDPDS